MAELYLNLAECNAELYVRGGGSGNDLADALENVNLVRSRAGVPELEASDCTSEMSDSRTGCAPSVATNSSWKDIVTMTCAAG